jgi:hypothetical protein
MLIYQLVDKTGAKSATFASRDHQSLRYWLIDAWEITKNPAVHILYV